MKRFLKVIAMILIVTLAVTLVPVEAHAKGKTCGYKGCTRSTENCSNGTVYCNIHAAAYAREQGYKVCAASGCYSRASSNSSYCSSHICKHSKCTNKAITKGGYCSEHKCKYSGCTNCAYYTSGANKGYCTTHAKSTGKRSTYSSSKKSTTKKKTYNTLDFDPDDYDSPEDYADDAWGNDFDDWDDAYDYWENW